MGLIDGFLKRIYIYIYIYIYVCVCVCVCVWFGFMPYLPQYVIQYEILFIYLY